MKTIAACKLPKAGLGNQLFPLMKAHLMAELNNLPVLVTGYHQLKIGPYLRREKSKRHYRKFFRFEGNLFMDLIAARKINAYSNIVQEQLPEQKPELEGNTAFLYSAIPDWRNYFEGLQTHRDLVRKLLQRIVHNEHLFAVDGIQAPVIGVHVRMGDFRKLTVGQDFAAVGATRTPLQYFSACIQQIREIHGSTLPVSIFSDGYPHELAELLSMENTTLVSGNSDIVDLLLLSRSKVIVTSAGSTFSYWAAFLSDAVVIHHPDHSAVKIRPEAINNTCYEGPWAENKEDLLLINNIRSIVE